MGDVTDMQSRQLLYLGVERVVVDDDGTRATFLMLSAALSIHVDDDIRRKTGDPRSCSCLSAM